MQFNYDKVIMIPVFINNLVYLIHEPLSSIILIISKMVKINVLSNINLIIILHNHIYILKFLNYKIQHIFNHLSIKPSLNLNKIHLLIHNLFNLIYFHFSIILIIQVQYILNLLFQKVFYNNLIPYHFQEMNQNILYIFYYQLKFFMDGYLIFVNQHFSYTNKYQ